MADLRAQLALFFRKFPQSLFSVFVMAELKGGSIDEYIFWLANRGRFNPDDPSGAANFDLLLGIDLHARNAALLIGYGLENYLSEEDLENALAAGLVPWRDNDIIGGVRACIDSVTERMRTIARQIEEERARADNEPLVADT